MNNRKFIYYYFISFHFHHFITHQRARDFIPPIAIPNGRINKIKWCKKRKTKCDFVVYKMYVFAANSSLFSFSPWNFSYNLTLLMGNRKFYWEKFSTHIQFTYYAFSYTKFHDRNLKFNTKRWCARNWKFQQRIQNNDIKKQKTAVKATPRNKNNKCLNVQTIPTEN